jgi:hypothetical protein
MGLVVAALGVAGCGNVTPNPDPVGVTGTVTHAGKPVESVILHFQPTGVGAQAMVTVTNGAFEADLMPGTYTYYITKGNSAEAIASIDPKYAAGAMDRQIDVVGGAALEIELD